MSVCSVLSVCVRLQPWLTMQLRCVQMIAADVDVTAKKHCYLCVYALVDRLNMDSYFQPYYSTTERESESGLLGTASHTTIVFCLHNGELLCCCACCFGCSLRCLLVVVARCSLTPCRHSADGISQHAHLLGRVTTRVAGGLLLAQANRGSQAQHRNRPRHHCKGAVILPH